MNAMAMVIMVMAMAMGTMDMGGSVAANIDLHYAGLVFESSWSLRMQPGRPHSFLCASAKEAGL
jgi:hypothetical protein